MNNYKKFNIKCFSIKLTNENASLNNERWEQIRWVKQEQCIKKNKNDFIFEKNI